MVTIDSGIGELRYANRSFSEVSILRAAIDENRQRVLGSSVLKRDILEKKSDRKTQIPKKILYG